MKRLIPTLVLVVLCVGAFWYASSQNFFKKEEEPENKTLVSAEPDQISGIRIHSSGGDVELQKKNNEWEMVKPSALPLDANETENWTYVFGTLTYESVVDENPADPAEFGLASPEVELEAKLPSGSKTIQVGSPLSIPGYYYVKLKDAPAVYQVSEEQISALMKTPFDFMQKAPFQLTYDDVQSVQAEWKGEKRTLQKSDPSKSASESNWKLNGQDMTGDEAQTVLDKVLSLTTEKLVRPAAEVRLDRPDFRLDMKTGKDSSTAISVAGKIDQDDVWIAKQGDKWAYAIPTAKIDELFDAMKK